EKDAIEAKVKDKIENDLLDVIPTGTFNADQEAALKKLHGTGLDQKIMDSLKSGLKKAIEEKNTDKLIQYQDIIRARETAIEDNLRTFSKAKDEYIENSGELKNLLDNKEYIKLKKKKPGQLTSEDSRSLNNYQEK